MLSAQGYFVTSWFDAYLLRQPVRNLDSRD